MGVVVDTSALVALERAQVRALQLEDEPAVVPAIVYAELRVGARLGGDAARAIRRSELIEALVSRLPVIDFDRAIADRWAELFVELTRAGAMIPSNDLQVAATAKHLDYSVLLGPKGERHFESVPGLRIARLRA